MRRGTLYLDHKVGARELYTCLFYFLFSVLGKGLHVCCKLLQ